MNYASPNEEVSVLLGCIFLKSSLLMVTIILVNLLIRYFSLSLFSPYKYINKI